MEKRLDWVDIFKGIAIILVVIGHTKSPWTPLVYLFHAPAFFFISGYTTNLAKYSFVEFTRRKIRTLMVPYFCVNILFLVYYAIIQRVPRLSQALVSQPVHIAGGFKQLFLNLLGPTDLAGATWFLLALFVASCVLKLAYDLLGNFKHKEAALGLFAAIAMGTGLYTAKHGIVLPYLLDLSYVSIGFIYMGILFRRLRIFESQMRHTMAGPLAIAILTYFMVFHWAGMDFPSRSFPAIAGMLLATTSGIYVLHLLSIWLARTAMSASLIEVGRNTLAILCFHFAMFKPAYWLLGKLHLVPPGQLKELLPIIAFNWYWPIIVVIGIGLSIALARLIKLSDWLNFALLGGPVPELNKLPRRIRDAILA